MTIKGVDADAEVEPDEYVALEKEASKKGSDSTLPISTERVLVPAVGDTAPARTDLKVTLAQGEGIKRGTYVLFVRYATDMKAQKTLTADGASSQIRWVAPRGTTASTPPKRPSIYLPPPPRRRSRK